MFAICLSTQLPRFYSWKPDPLAEATDAFSQQWGQLRGYTNPPWCLIAKVLSQTKIHQAQVILVAPVWPTMVPSTAGNVVRLPPTTTSLSEPVSVDVRHRTYGHSASTSHMAYLRQKFGHNNLSESAKELLLASWRNKTSKAYDSHFRKWLGWCTKWGCDPISGPVSDVANFLADLHSQGYQTSSLNAYQSAISSVHDRVDDTDMGKHPLISRLLKGAFHARPPLPRYSRTWNVEVVLNCMQQWGDTVSLSLKLLTFKLVMLMCLARPSRSADIASLCVDKCQFKPEGVAFLPSGLSKQAKQGKALTEYFLQVSR